jgi:hypothetical protein
MVLPVPVNRITNEQHVAPVLPKRLHESRSESGIGNGLSDIWPNLDEQAFESWVKRPVVKHELVSCPCLKPFMLKPRSKEIECMASQAGPSNSCHDPMNFSGSKGGMFGDSCKEPFGGTTPK